MTQLVSDYDCNINEVSACWKDEYLCVVYWDYEACPKLRGTTTICPDLISSATLETLDPATNGCTTQSISGNIQSFTGY